MPEPPLCPPALRLLAGRFATLLLNERLLPLPLANPDLNRRIESFEFKGRRVTNYEMESAPLAGLGRLMGHRCMTVCSIIANRFTNVSNPNYKNGIRSLIETVLERI